MITVPCRGLLFDCDGVLVDSDAGIEAAWKRWAHDLGLDPSRVLATVHGRRTVDTVAEFVGVDERAAALDRIDRYELEELSSTRPIAGAVTLTASLPSDAWAVVTSGTAPLARARLESAGIQAPRVLVAAEDVEAGKPDPQGYRLAARRLGLPPEATVVLEDAVAGAQAARAAGVGVVVGVGTRDLNDQVDIRVADLTSLRWSGNILYMPY